MAPASSGHTGTSRSFTTSVDETVVIPFDNWSAYQTDLGSSDTLVYDIQVTSGSEVDLYIVPPGGYTLYRTEAFAFTYHDQAENSLRIQRTFGELDGTAVFIVDNAFGSGATPRGNVTVHVSIAPAPVPAPDLWVFGLCGLLVAVAVLTPTLVFLHNRKKKRELLQSLPPPQTWVRADLPPPPPPAQPKAAPARAPARQLPPPPPP